MTRKEEWKAGGKELRYACRQFGKTTLRSVDRVIEMTDENAPEPETTVFSDGSWRATGKSIGKAFKDLGITALASVRTVIENNENQN